MANSAFTVGLIGRFGIGLTECAQQIWQMLLDARVGTFPLAVSGSFSAAPQSVTPNFEDLAATESQVIPIGAKGYTITILTGTATINGKTAPAGYSVGDPNILLATVTVTMAAASTGLVAWNT